MSETLEQELERKQIKLDKDQAEINKLAKQAEALTEDIGKIKTAMTDQQQELDTYRQAWSNLDASKSDDEKYLTTKTSMVEAAIGKKKGAIDKIISQWADESQKKKEHAKQLQSDLDTASTSYADKQQRCNEKQAAYDALGVFQQTLEAKLKAVQDLRDKIEEEDAKTNVETMYFLLKELASTLGGIGIPSGDELQKQLQKAWSELSEAKDALRDAEQAANAAKAEAQTAQADSDDFEKNRRAEILKRIEAWKAGPPQDQANSEYVADPRSS